MSYSCKMRINILNNQNIYPVNPAEVRRLVRFTFAREGIKRANIELGLIFVDDAQITELNRRYLSQNFPTDVICFCFWEDDFYLKPEALGEIIISVEQARKVSRRLNKSLEEELFLYIIHGVLHLIGYIDDTPYNRKRMNGRCREILEKWLYRSGRKV